MMHPRGHLPDHDEVVKKRRGLHLYSGFALIIGLASSLPMQTTNRAKMPVALGGPGILNQKDTGSCEGHAHASGGTLLFAIQGKSQGLISPSRLYLGALRCDQTLNPDGTLSTVTDAGTMPASIQAAWQTFGAGLAANDTQYPASSSTMYQDPSDPNSPLILPPPEKLYADSPYRYDGMFFITAQGTARLLQALTTLAAGRPITDAIPASGAEFQNYSGGVLGALSGPIDHANLLVDYEWTGTAADWQSFVTALQQGSTSQAAALAADLILHCVNSWDITWGEGDAVATMTGGMYRANTAYFDQAQDLGVLDLSLAA